MPNYAQTPWERYQARSKIKAQKTEYATNLHKLLWPATITPENYNRRLDYDMLVELLEKYPKIITVGFLNYALEERRLSVTNEEWDSIVALIQMGNNN